VAQPEIKIMGGLQFLGIPTMKLLTMKQVYKMAGLEK